MRKFGHGVKATFFATLLSVPLASGLSLAAQPVQEHNHDHAAAESSYDLPNDIKLYTGKDWSKELTVTNRSNGITTGDIIIGNPKAQIVVEEYASFTCGHCAQFNFQVLPKIEASFIKAGAVKWVFKNLVRDGQDFVAAKLLRCAAPDKTKQLMDTLFKNQVIWIQQNPGAILDYAKEAGISPEDQKRCQSDAGAQKALFDILDEAGKRGVRGTPSVFIDGQAITYHSLADLMNALSTAHQKQ